MLEPAIKYKDKIEEKLIETWYDSAYQYYYDYMPMLPDFPKHPDNQRQFASVDSKGNVLGYLSYDINSRINRACNFGIISFDRGNPIFIRDCRQMIADVFFKFHMTGMEWFCFADNPAAKLYDKFIVKYGGTKVGTLHNAAMAGDGKIHDIFIYEIVKSDLCHCDFTKDGNIVCKCPLATDTTYGEAWQEEYFE